MSRKKQSGEGKGSLKDIQKLINQNNEILNGLIKSKIKRLNSSNIEWVSPLLEDDYAEYSDNHFISRLNIKLKKELKTFWPTRGPQWDALGKTECNEVLLIEAKANIPEIVSSGTSAKSSESLKLINKSLEETKAFLNIDNNIDWSNKFYQYTNRIAHLYFLREINEISAFLVNIYFYNDSTVNGPTSKKEWLAAIEVMKNYLGVKRNKLSKYMVDLFIDVEDLSD